MVVVKEDIRVVGVSEEYSEDGIRWKRMICCSESKESSQKAKKKIGIHIRSVYVYLIV